VAGITEDLFHEYGVLNGEAAQEKVESAQHSLQQLKPKIAALATRLEKYSERHSVDNEFWFIVAEMRQLSGS